MITPVSDSKYEIIKKWWSDRGHTSTPAYVMLPEVGFISYIDGRPTAASFMYVDSSHTGAWAAWTVTRPKSTYEERNQALREIYDAFTALARAADLKFIFTEGPDTPAYAERLESNGFVKCDSKMAHFIKTL